ncbi:MAG: nitrogenase component 1 [Pseudomonadota bacterium]
MSGPIVSTRVARRLDEDLHAAADLLRGQGLDCLGLHVERGGQLRMDFARRGTDAAQIVLEDADDEAPRGPAIGMGRRRLVVLGPEMYAKDAQALLQHVRDALDADEQGPLALWMAPPEQGSDRICRSGGGLSVAIAGRLALGTPVRDGWRPVRFSWVTGNDGVGVEMVFSAIDGGPVIYLLSDGPGPAGSVAIAATPLGPLVRRQGPGAVETQHPLDDPLGFILRQALPLDARWTGARTREEDATELLGRMRQSTGLIGDCNRGGPESLDERRSRFFDVWGTSDALGNSASVAIRGDRVLLMHASRECALATNTLSGDLAVGMRPWGEERVDLSLAPTNYLVTDVDDATIVMGGEARYQEALREGLARRPEGEVVVFQGCDYHMIGDDVRGACRRCAITGKERVRFMQPEIPQFREMDSRSWWGNFLDECAAAGATPSPAPRVNLVGYGAPGSRSVQAAAALLEAAGITLGATALPFLSDDAVGRWGEAWLTLGSPWLPVDEVFTHHLRAREMPHAAPPLPYGIAGSRAWLGAVAAALGIPSVASEAFGALMSDRAPGLSASVRAVQEAGGRIGVIFDKGTLEELLSPVFFFGASPLDVLTGSGFEVTFVHAPITGPAQVPGDAALSMLADRGATFEGWEAGVGIRDVLEHTDFDLVYCDALEAGFIMETGAVPFDIRDLGMGPGGVARGIEHLLAGCRLTLYRRRRRRRRSAQ